MRNAGSGHPTRRLVLKGSVGGLAGLTIAGTALFAARAADAPAWPSDAFKQKSEVDALKALYDGRTAEASDKVKLDAPEIAENGAVVPVAVSSTLPNVTSIAILVMENPSVLAASYKLGAATAPSVASRLKMAKTSNLVAVVESGGKLFSARKEVKVTVGGCGGRFRRQRPKPLLQRINLMASTIRVRAVANGESTEVQSLIQHPMDSGFVKDTKGELIPPHHIEVVEFEYDGQKVFTALWGPAVSKDP